MFYSEEKSEYKDIFEKSKKMNSLSKLQKDNIDKIDKSMIKSKTIINSEEKSSKNSSHISYNKKFKSLEETNKVLMKKFEDFEKIIQIKDKEIEIEKKNYDLLSKNYDKITTLIEHAIENKFEIIKNNNSHDDDNKYILIDSNRKLNVNK